MAMFIRELVKVLDKEDASWRRYTMILHDGAKYCKKPVFTEVIK